MADRRRPRDKQPYAMPRYTVCKATGKRRYRKLDDAQIVLLYARWSEREWKPKRAYRCPLCHGWHLTSRE